MREVERPATKGERNDVRKNGDQPGRERKKREKETRGEINFRKEKQAIYWFI